MKKPKKQYSHVRVNLEDKERFKKICEIVQVSQIDLFERMIENLKKEIS